MDNPTGMDAVKAALQKRSEDEGVRYTLIWLAKQLGITRGAVNQWDKIPAERIGEVHKLTGVSPQVLRPDLFEAASE